MFLTISHILSCVQIYKLCEVIPACMRLLRVFSCLQILRHLKVAFWPFQHDQSGESLFLRAAHAANCINGSKINEDRYFNNFGDINTF